jgi:hypothetical protein
LGRKGGRCVGLTTLRPSCADFLENWEPQPPGTQACNGIALSFIVAKYYISYITEVTGDSAATVIIYTLSKQKQKFPSD